MQIINYGHFTRDVVGGFMWFKNELDQDWNAMQMGNQEGVPQLVVLGDAGVFISSIHPVWCAVQNGVVTHIEFDPSRIVPDGKTVLGIDGVTMNDVEPGMLYQGGQLLPKPYVPPPPYTIPVAAMWGRFADDMEAEAFDTAMSTASPFRLRKAFQSATQLTSGTELFDFVKGVLTSSISAQRADEILAPLTPDETASAATESL